MRLAVEVSETCRERLVGAGFRARASDIFTRVVTEDVLGWLGLNRAVGRNGSLVEINPVIGVRHHALESLVADLLGVKPHSYIPATLSVSVGYLMPDAKYRPSVFRDDVPVAGAADDLVAEVVEYGIPFMEGHGSLAAIVESMESGEGAKELLAFRLPVGYLLLGEPKFAMAALAASESAIEGRQDLAAQRFLRFATAFRDRLDVSQEG